MKRLLVTTKNAMWQQLDALKRNREKRARAGRFFLEGVHPMECAVAGGWEFSVIAYARGARLSGWARDMLARAHTDAVCEMDAGLLAELSDRQEPCELIALCKMPEDAPSALAARLKADINPLVVVFDRPQSPGNLGTVLRSADAFGATGLIVCGHAADFFDPQCVRASVGAMFHMPFLALPSANEAREFMDSRRPGLLYVGTSARGDVLLSETKLTGPLALVIGNETFGLSRAWKDNCDTLARIPISGAASSLNAGCAASICLYEIARQREKQSAP